LTRTVSAFLMRFSSISANSRAISSNMTRFASIVCQPHCLAAARLGRAPQFVNPPLTPLLLCRLRHAACPPVIAEKGKFALMGEDKKDSESKRESAKRDDQATEEAPRSLADNRKRRAGDKDDREQAKSDHRTFVHSRSKL
jgi:hypothetical protein